MPQTFPLAPGNPAPTSRTRASAAADPVPESPPPVDDLIDRAAVIGADRRLRPGQERLAGDGGTVAVRQLAVRRVDVGEGDAGRYGEWRRRIRIERLAHEIHPD